jgi:uncharacterized damage-inducible protein DinB
MDFSKVTHPKAKFFLQSFFANREINREFYQLVPEESFDFRMINTPDRKSDSPKESLAHQINVQYTYMQAIDKGKLSFGAYSNQKLKVQTKAELLTELKKADQELIQILSNKENCNKKIKVPWSKEPIFAVDMLWALDQHEVLHTGWNLAIMDHLGIERFPSLKKMWG